MEIDANLKDYQILVLNSENTNPSIMDIWLMPTKVDLSSLLDIDDYSKEVDNIILTFPEWDDYENYLISLGGMVIPFAIKNV